jgi:HK97 family phage prohead protease
VTPGQARGGGFRIAGYAALFGVADAAGDRIRPGAFARALAEAGELPLLWQHDSRRRIGAVERIAEDGRGLRVIARIDNAESRAARLLRARAVSGLSFGYRARGYRRVPRGRVLEDIDLFEVSLVTWPLQHGARVHLTE